MNNNNMSGEMPIICVDNNIATGCCFTPVTNYKLNKVNLNPVPRNHSPQLSINIIHINFVAKQRVNQLLYRARKNKKCVYGATFCIAI